MFAASREAVLSSCKWKNTNSIDYVEATRYENSTEATSENFRHGSLHGNEILEWVDRKGPHAAPDTQKAGKLLGQIRLLIYERTAYTPIDFPVSKDIFIAIEKAFHLHAATLPSFETDEGTYSRYLTFSDSKSTKLERIAFILKAPQKREIGNYGLSLSHEVATGVTTALLYGKGVLIRTGADNFWPHIPSLLDLVRFSVQFWHHPLLLPCLLLGDHMRRTKHFCERGTVMTETVEIEQELGVTKVGRSADIIPGTLFTYQEKSFQPYENDISRRKALSLTVRINTQSTRILFTARSPAWNKDCSKFTLGLLADIEPYLPDQHLDAHRASKESLEYNINLAEAVASHVMGAQERMSLQLDVLYNMVAQMDNRLSAKLSASAGRDSVSMKILAFITAFFLPGSFISGMFSMGMFDWQHDADGGVISGRFWIYWAIAIPLTAVTLLGWGIWWGIEMKRFEKGFADALDETAKTRDKQEMEKQAWMAPGGWSADEVRAGRPIGYME